MRSKIRPIVVFHVLLNLWSTIRFQLNQFLHGSSIFDIFIGCIHPPCNRGVAVFFHVSSNNFPCFQEGHIVGFVAEGHGQRARLCCRLISDSIFWLYYFTPTLASRCDALPKKVPKELYKRKDMQQIRDEDVSFILSFIYWVQQPFYGWGSFSWIHWNGWILQLRCQKYVNRFMHVFVLIWYFELS